MTTTPHDVQREAILAAVRVAGVATAAGVDPLVWGSTSAPRVLCSDAAGYVGAIHRGRLPLVEIWQGPTRWERQTKDGGLLATEWRMRAHVPGPSWADAQARALAIIQTAFAALRANAYLEEGGEAVEELQASPLGFSLVASVQLFHSFARDTYETDATIIPPPPPVETGILPVAPAPAVAMDTVHVPSAVWVVALTRAATPAQYSATITAGRLGSSVQWARAHVALEGIAVPPFTLDVVASGVAGLALTGVAAESGWAYRITRLTPGVA